jgi:hypothetical protein
MRPDLSVLPASARAAAEEALARREAAEADDVRRRSEGLARLWDRLAAQAREDLGDLAAYCPELALGLPAGWTEQPLGPGSVQLEVRFTGLAPIAVAYRRSGANHWQRQATGVGRPAWFVQRQPGDPWAYFDDLGEAVLAAIDAWPAWAGQEPAPY